MSIRTLRIVLVLLVPLAMLASYAFGEEQAASPAVRIYLPRTRTVDKAALTIDDVAIVSGENDALAMKVRAVPIGRAPFAGESLTINRQTILAQLGAADIATTSLKIMGARQTRINRKATDIGTEDIIAAAQAYMKANAPAGTTRWELATQPKEISLPAKDGAKLQCRLAENQPSGQMHVEVLLATDAKVLATRRVVFRVMYQTRRLTATKDIAPGQTVTPANTKLDTVEVATRPDSVYVPPFGKKARVHIKAGAQITDSYVHEPKPPVVIQRNQTVRLRIQGKGWCITALATALQNGRVGDTIRVRNIDSRRIVAGTINEHGYVVPVMPRAEVAVNEERTP